MAKEKITYQESVSELEDIVNEIESAEIDIDELSKKVKRAFELIKGCRAKLKSAELEIEKILEDTEE